MTTGTSCTARTRRQRNLNEPREGNMDLDQIEALAARERRLVEPVVESSGRSMPATSDALADMARDLLERVVAEMKGREADLAKTVSAHEERMGDLARQRDGLDALLEQVSSQPSSAGPEGLAWSRP